jgi:diguanylate cyclase (GGDEF)-like protein
MFYLWVVVVAFFFLRPRQALLQAFFVVAAFTALLTTQEPPAAVEAWIVAIGTAAVMAAALTLMRRRVNRLVGGLRGAVSRLEQTARTDPLTGLLNRRGFEELMDAEIERGHRGGRPLSLLIGDLDHFKRLNDTHGHLAGDRALRSLAWILQSSKRKIDTVARIGGEEFAIVAPETDQHGAYILAENLRERVASAAVHGGLTLSFGVATFPRDGGEPRTLMHSADQALYVAKEMGRDTSVVYKADVATDALRRRRGGEREGPGQLSAVLLLAETLDVHDTGTAEHSRRVADYVVAIATQLCLPTDRVERLRIAGLVHDIGKIGLPDAILRKPGPLTRQELADVRKHPERGAEILTGAELDDLRSWILAHHERPDGGGYPFGLRGRQIPLEASIVAVADAYDAMTSDRSFRRAVAPTVATSELLRCAGTQFDGKAVAALVTALGFGEQPDAGARARRGQPPVLCCPDQPARDDAAREDGRRGPGGTAEGG